MIEKDTLIKVTNRDDGYLGYTIPDLGNLHRDFAPGESKNISFEELQKLSWIRGGDVLLKQYLRLDNDEAVRELLSDVEPEYYYTETDIKNLLNNGSLEQLQDCLDFAPVGVIELVKNIAVKEEISDVRKREAICKKTGLNITKAIEINKETVEENNTNGDVKVRRSTPIIKSDKENKDSKSRRTSAPQKYNVVK